MRKKLFGNQAATGASNPGEKKRKHDGEEPISKRKRTSEKAAVDVVSDIAASDSEMATTRTEVESEDTEDSLVKREEDCDISKKRS